MNSYYVQWLGKKFTMPKFILKLNAICLILWSFVVTLAVAHFGFSAMKAYLGTPIWLNLIIMVVLVFQLNIKNKTYELLPNIGKDFVYLAFVSAALYYVWKDSQLEQMYQIMFSTGVTYIYVKFIYKKFKKFYNKS